MTDDLYPQTDLAVIDFAQWVAVQHFYANHVRNPFKQNSIAYEAYRIVAHELIIGAQQ